MTDKQQEALICPQGFTFLPDVFFTHIMPKIQDIAELKVTLYIFYLLNRKRRDSKFVTREELLSLGALMGMDEETIHRALGLTLEHGIILMETLDIDGKLEEAYSISSLLSLQAKQSNLEEEATLNIFALYEQNIGIITPMIAEELNEAEKLYPPQWIEEAFKEAVRMNKRNWKYITRILERWASEGRESGEYRKSAKEGSPDKYIKGKYGHLVKR